MELEPIHGDAYVHVHVHMRIHTDVYRKNKEIVDVHI